MLLAHIERCKQRPNGGRYCMYPGKGSCRTGSVEWRVQMNIGGRLKTFYCCTRHAELLTRHAAEADPDERKAASFEHAAELAQ